MRLIIHASNIHCGGGLAILRNFLSETLEIETVCIVDERANLGQVNEDISVSRIKPNLICRLVSEWKLRKNYNENDIIMCLGNLPPLFGSSAIKYVLVHNRLLLEGDLTKFSLKTRIRLIIERLWLRSRLAGDCNVIVQTESMRRLFKNELNIDAKKILFQHNYKKKEDTKERKFDFIYVASGDIHKNHRNLILAWEILAKDQVFPSLQITLDGNKKSGLIDWIKQRISQLNLDITLIGEVEPDKIANKYGNSDCLIYPSLLESLGLPLLEAQFYELPIIASELDYVRDVCEPRETFDPNSPISISRAVKRYMKIHCNLENAVSTKDFLLNVIGKEL